MDIPVLACLRPHGCRQSALDGIWRRFGRRGGNGGANVIGGDAPPCAPAKHATDGRVFWGGAAKCVSPNGSDLRFRTTKKSSSYLCGARAEHESGCDATRIGNAPSGHDGQFDGIDNGGIAFDVRVVGEAADIGTLRNIVVRNNGGLGKGQAWQGRLGPSDRPVWSEEAHSCNSR